MGHRGLIIKLVFHPDTTSLKLLSTAEDFLIKVWDLVLKKEVAVLKPKGKFDNMAHMTTSMIFTKDKKTLITSGRDGCVHFWNVMDNFKLISSLLLQAIGCDKEEEILSLAYLPVGEDPCLVLGGTSGNVTVYSIKKQQIVYVSGISKGFNTNTEEVSDTIEI
mgnify:FL=1